MYASIGNALKNTNALKPSAALRSAMRARGRRTGSITYFYSPKNNQDLIFSNELEFCCGLLLEADERVKTYEVDPGLIDYHLDNTTFLGDKPNFVVIHHDGSILYRKTKYMEIISLNIEEEKNKFFADSAGVSWDYFTEDHARRSLRLIHDWLLISTVLAQTRYSVAAKWGSLSRDVISTIGNGIILENLQKMCDQPWDEVFSTVFKLVQLGIIESDLESLPLSPQTVLKQIG